MSLIPEQFLNATVAIGRYTAEPSAGVMTVEFSNVAWFGTGFIVGQKIAEDSEGVRFSPLLVTNRHVLSVDGNLVCAFRGTETNLMLGIKGGPHGKDDIYCHPDESVDLAVTPIDISLPIEKGNAVGLLSLEANTWTLSQMHENDVGEGDMVFTMGYPLGIVGSYFPAAIVRQGAIARIRDSYESQSEFLIDSSVFPGHSGGPVFLRPEPLSLDGIGEMRDIKLVGIAQAYLPYEEEAVSLQTGRTRIVFQENSGLSPIIPIDRLHELVDEVNRKDPVSHNK